MGKGKKGWKWGGNEGKDKGRERRGKGKGRKGAGRGTRHANPSLLTEPRLTRSDIARSKSSAAGSTSSGKLAVIRQVLR